MSFNLNNLMLEAQRMQEQLSKMKSELKNKTIETELQSGAIKITCNGHQQILAVKLCPVAFPIKNREELEELLIKGINQALANSKLAVQEEITKLTGGLDLPGLKEFF